MYFNFLLNRKNGLQAMHCSLPNQKKLALTHCTIIMDFIEILSKASFLKERKTVAVPYPSETFYLHISHKDVCSFTVLEIGMYSIHNSH